MREHYTNFRMNAVLRTLPYAICFFLLLIQDAAAQVSSSDLPRVFLLDAKQLAVNKQRVREGDKRLAPALAELRNEARKALLAGPFSVVTKPATPPSGDKHDYISQAPYFWPNPDTANHLPYVRRDGERNPEINKFPDHQSMDKMVSAVETLALAYYFEGDEAALTKLLGCWVRGSLTRRRA